MAQLLSLITAHIRGQRRLLACMALLFVTGCSQQQGRDVISQFREGKPQEFLQTSVDRMATLTMRDNLDSLYLLMNKLYLRTPTS